MKLSDLLRETKKYTPKENDWCWVSDSKDLFDPKLRKFLRYHNNEKVFAEPNGRQVIYLFCEPFVGELPTYLK